MSILKDIKAHIESKLKESKMDQSLKDFLNKEITIDNIVKMTTTSKDILNETEYYYTTEDYFLFHDSHINSLDKRVIKLSGENCGQQFIYNINDKTITIDTGNNVKYYTSTDKMKFNSGSALFQSNTIQIKEIFKEAAKANKENKRVAQEKSIALGFGINKVKNAKATETNLFER